MSFEQPAELPSGHLGSNGSMISQSPPQTFVRGQGILGALHMSSRRGVLARFLSRGALALLSAGLLACSLPGPDLGWLAWIALVPLLMACEGLSPVQAGALGFFTGMAANPTIYHWVFEVQGFGIHHFLILSTFFALFPAVWCAGVSWLSRRRSSRIFAATALWVLLDYVRAHAGFMAFPWGTLAQTQHNNFALLQVATIVGEYGVTFLVVMANTALADFFLTRTWRRAALIGLLIVLIHLGGTLVLALQNRETTIKVAVVQPNILLHERTTREGRAAVFDRLERLTVEAAGSHPALIVWPETAIAGNLRANPFLAADLMALVQEVRTPLVLGVGEVEKFATRDIHGNMAQRAYNAAYVAKPDHGLEAPYIKRVLMPFGEYVPLERVIGWPGWLAPPVFQTVVGNTPSTFRLNDGTPFAPLICWENLFGDLARESVQAGARLLVLLTNDGWFGHTAEPRQHNLASVLRAVENRVPIVVASNTGPSQIIDPYGRVIVQAASIFHQEVITGDVTLGAGGTLYTRTGDVFVFLVVAGLAIVALRCWLSHGGALSNEANHCLNGNNLVKGDF